MSFVGSLFAPSPAARLAWVLVCLLSWPVLANANGVTIGDAYTTTAGSVYELNAAIRYELSEEVLEALENGVGITLRVRIKIERPRAWLWNETIGDRQQRYRLKFHALSNQYIVKNLDNKDQQSYLTLTSALRALGRIRKLPIIKQASLDEDSAYIVKVHSELDTNALPAPLRPVAWLSRGWQLSSEWFTCPLQS